MKVRQTPIATAVALSLVSMSLAAQAQDAAGEKKEVQQLEAVIVTGIRAAKDKALNLKRLSENHVEVISAEDVGKMPDKNIADSLQRVPGVSISSASGAEGGFDENDKVSMRGTSPSLTQTLIDGHNVAGGEWFILNQTGESGRSVSYTLLPAEIVGQVVVHKSAEASLIEGGTTGSVNIVTRKPLDFKKTLSLDVNVGGVYSDLAKKTDPQLSAVLAWRNPEKTVGVMAQVFSEKRSLRRDGVEVLGYSEVSNANVLAKYPQLKGVKAPNLIGAAFFEQERQREGALVKLQLKPSDTFSTTVTAYTAELDADNYNRNYMLWGSKLFGWGGQASVPDSVTVTNNTVTAASWSKVVNADGSQSASGVYDMISRPKSGSSMNFVAVDAQWTPLERLSFDAKVGTSSGKGYTQTQDILELDIYGPASFKLNGVNSAPVFNVGNKPNPNDPNTTGYDWIFGYNNITVDDKETWGQIDGVYTLADEGLRELKFGVRATEHTRSLNDAIGQRPACIVGGKPNSLPSDWAQCQGGAPWAPANWQLGTPSYYPGNFSYAGNVPGGLWYYTPEQLATLYSKGYVNRDPAVRRDYGQMYSLTEKVTAAYVQGNFGWGKLSGNVGVRLVKTSQDVENYANVQGLATKPFASTAFGDFLKQNNSRSYTDVLPSLNLRYAQSKNQIYRASVTRTMTRPDYSVIASGTSLDARNVNGPNDLGTGGAPNFNINPVRSTNYNVAAEYYFAPRSVFGASLFYMDFDSLITGGKTRGQFLTEKRDPVTNQVKSFVATYELASFVNDTGSAKGIELMYEQPVWGNFGLNANYTYTDASRAGNKPMTGASKNTYNLGAFFENESWNARVSYNHRSEFLTGNDWTGNAMYALGTNSLAASLGYKFSDSFSITLDGRNLNNPKLTYYTDNKDQPRAFYTNGRQYYLSARMKF